MNGQALRRHPELRVSREPSRPRPVRDRRQRMLSPAALARRGRQREEWESLRRCGLRAEAEPVPP